MAYINQDTKKTIAEALKVALKDYPTIKYSLSIRDLSQIVCKITKGPQCLDVDNKGDVSVNAYWIDKHFNPEAAVILTKIKDCLNIDNYNNSDSQSDYFDCGHYIDIKIGAWDKPYIVV